MSKKYIKNNSGVVMSVTTEHLQLEKPLINEHYDIEVHNRNSDKIDAAIKNINNDLGGQIDTAIQNVSKDLSSHINDMNNPHNITASKIDAMPITGGVFEGIVSTSTNTLYTTKQLRNIFLSSSDPIDEGENGDIWIKYA